tara:strand:- start:6959 stop:8194 length:1236 start_codon:yes stop_codon:yes gene_type:complete
MKVLHVNAFDHKGGAARAAYRLHESLLRAGLNSQMLVQFKAGDDVSVVGPSGKIKRGMGLLRPTLDLVPTLAYRNRTQTLFSPAWLPLSGIVSEINRLAPDVVHLHWVNGGALTIGDIAKIKPPIVWTMHDMWAFTGGCHSDLGCGRYSDCCGSCPVIGSGAKKDLSSWVQSRKKQAFARKSDIRFIGVSNWLAGCARDSALLKGSDISVIPNTLNTQVFAPVQRKLARELLGLPQDRSLILFGAVNALADPNKGYAELKMALSFLRPGDADLVIFGSSRPTEQTPFRQTAHYMGYVHDDVALRLLYSAADVMVVPSYQEAFGQTASEAMACGTPVVAFGATGLLDIVNHKTNGYLAQPYDAADLADGITWVLDNSASSGLGQAAVEKVKSTFDYTVVASQMSKLYHEVVS